MAGHPWLRPKHLAAWYLRGDRLAKAARLRAEADRNRREVEALHHALTYARKRGALDILRQIKTLTLAAERKEGEAVRLVLEARSQAPSPPRRRLST